MEHSFITAYCALVLGVMCRYSEVSVCVCVCVVWHASHVLSLIVELSGVHSARNAISFIQGDDIHSAAVR